MAWNAPKSIQTVPIRPLSKGMATTFPGQLLPDGAFIDIKGALCNQKGIARYPGSSGFANSEAAAYTLEDYIAIWQSDGTQRNILLTDKVLYQVDPDLGLTEVAWAYSTGTITISGSIVTGSGTAWDTNDIAPGDLVRVGAYEALVENVASANAMTIKSSNIPDQSGVAYSIQRAFGNGETNLIDFTVADGYLLIADGKRPLLKYDPIGATLSYWMDTTAKMPAGTPVVPGCVAYYDDRVWIGDILSSADGMNRQRQYFSKLADKTDFSVATNYVDLPYTSSEIRRMLPLGKHLVLYFADMIFIGYPTNYPTAPVRYEKLETPAIGLVGKKAVCDIAGAHIFVGQDDVYIVTTQGIQKLDCPVKDKLIGECESLWRAYVLADPERQAVLFGMPTTTDYIDRVWIYTLDAKAWSYVELATTMIANPYIQRIISIDALTGTIDGLDATYPTIASMGAALVKRYILHEGATRLWQILEDATHFQDTIPIDVVIETKDFDFDDPEGNHAVCRLGVKIDYKTIASTPLAFTVLGSTNRGRAWKALGTLRIRSGDDEGHVDFRLAGSTARFRLSSADSVARYAITEMTLDVRGAGSDKGLRSQS